jgi:hypothetical protein
MADGQAAAPDSTAVRVAPWQAQAMHPFGVISN